MAGIVGVPEPPAVVLFALGLMALLYGSRRRLAPGPSRARLGAVLP